MKIAFICVSYNNAKISINYILNVLEINIKNEGKIIIIDNNSKKNDINYLENYILNLNNKDVVLLKSPTNLGYFKGLNLGLKWALENGYGECHVVGNNDLIFDQHFVEKLSQKVIDDNVLVLAPNIIKLDGTHQNPHVVNKFSKIERIYRRIYFSNFYCANILQFIYNLFRQKINKSDRINNNVEQEILMGYGACYILTKNFFRHFEKLDDALFLMGEEGLLANQILSVKGVTLYVPDIIVNHHDHSSIGKISNRKLYEFSKKSYFYYLSNLKHVQ
jgi:GT2 family glycosyltransferase